MSLLYLAQQGLKVRRRKAVLLLSLDDKPVARIPLSHISAIVAYGRIEFSSATLTACALAGIRVALASRTGRLLALVQPALDQDAAARIAQHAALRLPPVRLSLARKIVDSKLTAAASLLRSYRESSPAAAEAAAAIDQFRSRIPASPDIPSLLGLEGSAARQYWTAFASLNASQLPFRGRTSRPPKDPVNALLSFGYVLLATEIATLITATGLDPCIGYYHEPFRGRPALALDTMEPLRHDLIDRMVLTAINSGRFSPADFLPGDAPRLTPPARIRFLQLYEAALAAPPRNALAAPGAADMRTLIIRRCENLHSFFRRRAGHTEAGGESGSLVPAA
jgi:CRISPR-associated protein Cas1